MATYTVFIVTRNARHHYPVIMANNGKAILNEPVKRAKDLEKSANKFSTSAHFDAIEVIRITEKAFKAKFPKYAANKGPKKKAVKKPGVKNWTPNAGDKIVVKEDEGCYLQAGEVGTIRKGIDSMGHVQVKSHNPTRGKGIWYTDHTNVRPATLAEIKAGKGKVSAPAKRITKTVTNPVK